MYESQSLNSIVYSLLDRMRGGEQSDDESISLRDVAHWVHQVRALLLRRQVQKWRYLDPMWIQDLGCIPIVCVDTCCGEKPSIEVHKLEKQIPTTIQFLGTKSVQFVGLIDKQTQIPIVDAIQLPYLRKERFTGNARRAYFIENELYLDLPVFDLIEYVNVRAVLYNPLEAADFQDGIEEDCHPCITWDDPYPIPGVLIAELEQMVFSNYIQPALRGTQFQDTNNNRADDTTLTQNAQAPK